MKNKKMISVLMVGALMAGMLLLQDAADLPMEILLQRVEKQNWNFFPVRQKTKMFFSSL